MNAKVQKFLQSSRVLRRMTCFIVPEQGHVLTNDYVPDFPYQRTVEEARSEPLVVLHTSRFFPLSNLNFITRLWHH